MTLPPEPEVIVECGHEFVRKEDYDHLKRAAEELMQDAERYRYLRDKSAQVDGFWVANGIVGCLSQWNGEALDRALDAAIDSAKGKP